MSEAHSTRILGRSKRLTLAARGTFDRIFGSAGGDVLDFSIRTMTEWFEESFGLSIFEARYQLEGTSKGKTLRGFVEVGEPRLVAQVLRALWAYRVAKDMGSVDPLTEAELKAWLDQFTAELEASSAIPLDKAIVDFSGDTTLMKLRASIAADLTAGKPEVALDRVHTYCVKRLRHLLQEKGQSYGKDVPLHALFGAFGRYLKEAGHISDVALPMLRVQHRIFEGLNEGRNNWSLAHDNQLLSTSEAQFVVESTLAAMAFIERLQADLAEPV